MTNFMRYLELCGQANGYVSERITTANPFKPSVEFAIGEENQIDHAEKTIEANS